MKNNILPYFRDKGNYKSFIDVKNIIIGKTNNINPNQLFKVLSSKDIYDNLECKILNNKIRVFNAQFGSSLGIFSLLPVLDIKFKSKSKLIFTIKPNSLGLIVIFPFICISYYGIYIGCKELKIHQVVILLIFNLIIYYSYLKKYNQDKIVFLNIIDEIKKS